MKMSRLRQCNAKRSSFSQHLASGIAGPTAWVAICALLAACTTEKISEPYRPSAERFAVSVPASAGCKFTPELPENKNCCVMSPFFTPMHVDRAYSHLMREYRFSQEPKIFEEELEAVPNLYHGHQHIVRTGDAYRISGVVVPKSDMRLYRGIWLSVALTEIGPDTRVEAAYCQVAGLQMTDQALWHQAVQASLSSTLPAR
jgi:hypothetical protein